MKITRRVVMADRVVTIPWAIDNLGTRKSVNIFRRVCTASVNRGFISGAFIDSGAYLAVLFKISVYRYYWLSLSPVYHARYEYLRNNILKKNWELFVALLPLYCLPPNNIIKLKNKNSNNAKIILVITSYKFLN